MKPYEKLSLKEKADFVAFAVNYGSIGDYFDRIEKKANGYYYFCEGADIITRYSAESLVKEFEENTSIEEILENYAEYEKSNKA